MQAGLISSSSSSSPTLSTALSTLFNALTQTTTTLCANGQCFTIYSNAIASNLAAFGVTVTQISAVLVPLCCLLLGYTVWSLYRQRRDCSYPPFLLGLAGAILIILDNFLLGNYVKLHNIPSYAGNLALVISSVWAAKHTSEQRAPVWAGRK